MNKLYILCGLPYAGKTTLRKELVKRLNFDYVSVDEIMTARNMWNTPGQPTQEDWDIAYAEAYKQLEELLKEGKNAIADIGNLEFPERDNMRKTAESFGVEQRLIYVKTPRDEIMRRRKENEVTRVRGHLENELFASATDKFNEPSVEENPLIYNLEENLDEWIRKNII